MDDHTLSASLDESIARRTAFLTDYQDARYARQYTELLDQVRGAEHAKAPGKSGLVEAVARYWFKLLAYKDEYEVARLYGNERFWQQIRETFEGDYQVRFNLAPPLIASKDGEGHLIKREFGPWMRWVFRAVATLKHLRGTKMDIFGYTAERKMERKLIADYRATIEELLRTLEHGNHALALELARIPEQIRGYGHVKEAHLAKALPHWQKLLAAWRNPIAAKSAA